jgi:hypothetical protein
MSTRSKMIFKIKQAPKTTVKSIGSEIVRNIGRCHTAHARSVKSTVEPKDQVAINPKQRYVTYSRMLWFLSTNPLDKRISYAPQKCING